jgi:hypothetical protein
MQAESSPPRVLLRTKILLRDAYQRQGDDIITWGVNLISRIRRRNTRTDNLKA